MEAWVKIKAQGADYERLIGHHSTYARSGQYGVEFATDTVANQKFNILICGNSASSFGIESATGSGYTKDKWHHLLITRTGGYARCFIDGVLKRYLANTQNITGDLPTSFGASGTGGDVIDNVRIRDFRLVIGGVPTSYQTSDTVVGTSSITPPDEPLSLIHI